MDAFDDDFDSFDSETAVVSAAPFQPLPLQPVRSAPIQTQERTDAQLQPPALPMRAMRSMPAMPTEAPMPMMPMELMQQSVAQPLQIAQPQMQPQTIVENGHTLGLAVLLAGLGSAAGLAYGGLYGGVAGGLAGGSALNLWRAYRHIVKGTPGDDKEATISATYGVLGGAASLYLFWKASSSKTRKNEPKDEEDGKLHGVK